MRGRERGALLAQIMAAGGEGRRSAAPRAASRAATSSADTGWRRRRRRDGRGRTAGRSKGFAARVLIRVEWEIFVIRGSFSF